MIKFLITHSRIFFLGVLASLALSFNACTDVDNSLGDDFIDPSQKSGVSIDSSFAIDAYTVSTDSIYSSTLSGKCYLGSYNDPVFGQINSSVVTQFVPSSLLDYKKYAKNISGKIDSLVLTLKLKGGVGDSLALQYLTVYQMKKKVRSDSSYYSNYNIKDSIEVPSISVNKDLKPSAIAYSRKGNGVVRIRISTDFINKLFNSNIDTSKFTNYDVFLDYFKGLYIENSKLSAGGGLNGVDFSDTSSRMHLYFKVEGKVNKDSSVRMPFLIGTTLRKFCIIEHVYNGTSPYRPTNINPDFSNNANPTPQDLVYLQGLGGLRTMIKFNKASVALWENKNYKIHRAELIVEPFFPNGELSYPKMPMAITAYYSKSIDKKDVMLFVPDMATFKDVSTNAFYNRSRRLYSLNITTYFKNAMRDSSYPKELYLYAGVPASLYSSQSSYGTNYAEPTSDFLSVPNQVILGKPGKSNHIKLVITYSK
ncbi:DUF4270 family protein [Acetobacteroides hydrogenigenes]|nr:DUF4270 family protein [Acetobacteroides hydrogenigenes]